MNRFLYVRDVNRNHGLLRELPLSPRNPVQKGARWSATPAAPGSTFERDTGRGGLRLAPKRDRDGNLSTCISCRDFRRSGRQALLLIYKSPKDGLAGAVLLTIRTIPSWMCDITPALTRQPNFFTSTSCTNQNERDALLVRKTGCTSTSLPPHQEIQERLNEGKAAKRNKPGTARSVISWDGK